MNEKIKLSQNVMLIDAAFLNYVVADLKRHFEQALNRALQEIELSELITYLALDAEITEGKNEIQVWMVYDKDSLELVHCQPSDLKTALNGVAFAGNFGEFLFSSVPCEDMTTREELFLDLLTIVSDSVDVKKLMVVSFNEEYGDKVASVLKAIKEKSIIQFRMDDPSDAVPYRCEMLAYPVMQALGIRGDEL